MSWGHIDAAFRFDASEYKIKNTLAVGCKLFLLTLANYINKDTLLCIPSLETLSRDMGIGIKQTREYKKELINKKVISCNFIKGYKSPNFKLHLKHIKHVKTPPLEDTHIAVTKNLITTLGEPMPYPTNPRSTPLRDTLTIIKPLSNPIYKEIKKESLEKYIVAVSIYARHLGINTDSKGINMVEDEIRKAENPNTQPMTSEEKRLHMQNAMKHLEHRSSVGIKILK